MNWLRYALHVIIRAPMRPTLAILAVALAIALFCAVAAVDRGLQRMLSTAAQPDVLVVFDRFQSCPPLSKLPIAHRAVLEELPGVRDVTAELFVISSCSRVTDLVAVHGIEPGKVCSFRELEVAEDDFRAFASERGAALVGARAAAQVNSRRNGSSIAFQAGGRPMPVMPWMQPTLPSMVASGTTI